MWQNNKMARAESPAASRVSPLVAQAQIYAGLLNPPRPPKPVPKDNPTPPKRLPKQTTAKPQSVTAARPAKVSPTFKVHATSVFSKRPEKSMALISQPGKGLSWARPGDMLGYLKVIEIRKDAVVYGYEDTIGEVAWESGKTPASARPRLPSPTLAMDLPEVSTDPVPPPPAPASPLPSRLAAPARRMHPLSPRSLRGAK